MQLAAMLMATRRVSPTMDSLCLTQALNVLSERLTVGLVLAELSGRALFTNRLAERLLANWCAPLPPELQRFIEDVASSREAEATSRIALPGSRHPVTARGTRLPGTSACLLVTLNEQSPRPTLSKRLVERFGVSARSVRLVQLASRGLTNKEIGAALRLTEATVKTYMHGLFRDLGVRNRAELVALADRLANES